MDYNIPSHISPATLVRATRLAKSAESIKFPAGNVYWDAPGHEGQGDNVYFMFTKQHEKLLLVYCSPHGYFVERHNDRNTKIEFAMVTNVRHLLFWIRKNGFYNCEHLKKEDE